MELHKMYMFLKSYTKEFNTCQNEKVLIQKELETLRDDYKNLHTDHQITKFTILPDMKIKLEESYKEGERLKEDLNIMKSQKVEIEKHHEEMVVKLDKKFEEHSKKMREDFRASIKILQNKLSNESKFNDDMVKQNEDLDALLLKKEEELFVKE